MGDEFTAQLLKGFERRADEAKKQVEERARRAAEQRQRLKQQQEQAEKERLAAEVDKMMARANQRVSSKRKKRKKPSAANAASSTSAAAPAPKPPVQKAPVPRHQVNQMRTNYRAPPKRTAPAKAPKLGPDMEFVVRREKKKKQIRVPHTYDYSDMFGDDYWRGIDMDCAKKICKETAEATKEAQQILAERKAQREESKRKTEENIRELRELEKKGLLDEKTKNKRRLEQSEKDWVAVDTPVPVFRQKNSAIARAAQSAPSTAKPLSQSSIRPGSSSEPRSKKGTIAQISERARLFKERLMGLSASNTKKSALAKVSKTKSGSDSGSDIDRFRSLDKQKRPPIKRRVHDSDGSGSDGERRNKKRSRRPSEDSESDDDPRNAKRMRRAREHSGDSDSDTGYRRHSLKKSRRDRDDSDDSDADHQRHRRSSGSSKKRRSSEYGYNSEEWSNSDKDDDSAEEDLYDISALDREEERSARLAKLEDKRELEKLRREKIEKERRRQEFEKKRGQ